MSEGSVSSTTKLLRASSDDEAALKFDLPDSAFGFHTQQAVEKLYKALLVVKRGSHPYTHDLKGLRERIEDTGLVLPQCDFRLENLSEYAGNSRYDEPIPIDAETRDVLRRCIAELRTFVMDVLS